MPQREIRQSGVFIDLLIRAIFGTPTRVLIKKYEAEEAQAQSAVRQKLKREAQMSNLRSLLFLAALFSGVYWANTDRLAFLPAFFAGAFIVAIVVHDRLIKKRKRLERSVKFYELGRARLEDRWAGGGWDHDFAPSDHAYAADLDLFGNASLFEWLNTAQTTLGAQTLASWLLTPATPDVIQGRREALEVLAPQLKLREALFVAGGELPQNPKVDVLRRFGSAANPFTQMPQALGVFLSFSSSALILSGALYWGLMSGPPWLFVVGLLAVESLRRVSAQAVAQAVEHVAEPERELSRYAEILKILESTPEASKVLKPEFVHALNTLKPSAAVERLKTLCEQLEQSRNPFFMPLAWALHWDYLWCLGIEKWRATYGSKLNGWLDEVGRFEALMSLASHAHENPQDIWATLSTSKRPFVTATGVAHPLLPKEQCIANDVSVGTDFSATVISGSNMSGKSTYLRSIGVNVVLALSGAKVRAKTFSLSPLQLGTSMRTQDSLQSGASRFWAEIARLKQVFDLCEQELPLLFLLDEILSGTNSHDRKIGAIHYIKNLLELGATGLLTTHDLALAQLEQDFSGSVRNVHFQDDVVDGKITFDYRLREGVVQKSNALALMRVIGLKV